MPSDRQDKIKEAIREAAAEFLSRNSNRKSLITVTGVSLSTDGKRADVLFTVLPETQEQAALDFSNRRRADFKDFLLEKFRLGRIPHLEFKIDKGEKHRQHIDQILGK